MLVSSTVLPPPFTKTRPSGSMAVPGQNMSCDVWVTSTSREVDVTGSKMTVYVCVGELPPKVLRLQEAHVRTLPLGRSAAATGMEGNVMGEPQRPVLGGSTAGSGTVSTVKSWLDAVLHAACSMTAPLAVELPRTCMQRPLFSLRIR